MPEPKRERRVRSEKWEDIQQWTLWPEQVYYEEIRPIVLFGETPGERAKEIDVPRSTLSQRANNFERYGMASLFPSEEHGGERESSRTLPDSIRQLIIDLHAEAPFMSWREIAEICFIRYGRKPNHHSIKRVAKSSLSPSLKARRYQPWHLIPDPAERKLAAVRLHAEGWSITSIASYLQCTRHTIYDTLKRWMEEGVAGLEEKSRARKGPRKVTLKVANEVRRLQENPLLGKFRMHTALKRIGIEVSPTTCGRIMAANRQLYGLEKTKREARPKREMPFAAVRRHQYWSCDVRYIEDHRLDDPRPIYLITVFENFSRSVLSSKISTTQNQWDYLSVLLDAIRTFGAPEAIVTDGGGIFASNMALELYKMLDIRKERIDAGAPWQNYAETLFSIQKRLSDFAFAKARTWPEVQQVHQTWWKNYNQEDHLAHHKRQDGRHSPNAVLRGVLGRTYPQEVLQSVLYATQFTRYLDQRGYARFKKWRFFGEDGLAGEEVSIWMYEGMIKIEHQTTTLAEYAVRTTPDHKQIEEVRRSRRIETHFRSPQLRLWQTEEHDWILALRQPERQKRIKRRGPADIVQLSFLEMIDHGKEMA